MAVKNNEIEDIEQLQAWLWNQKAQVAQALAARAALRSLPAILLFFDRESPNIPGPNLLLFGLRATLMTCVSSTRVETDVELQSTAFGFVSTSKAPIRADSAVGAVNYAILSVAHAQEGFAKEYGISAVRSSMPIVGASFGPPTLSEISSLAEVKAFDIHPIGVEIALNESIRDAYEFINRGVFSVFRQRLWKHSTIAERHTQKWDKFAARSDPEGVWSFWKKWYQGFLDGKPLNWELQRRVALIADDIWNAGPEAVADEIERIQVRYLADQLPLAETIDLNPDTGKFRATPTPVENAPLMSALLTQISDDLEDAMAGHNGVTKSSSEARKIRRVVTRYGNDPQQAELTLTSVAKGLRRQLYETGELPDSEDNLALLNSVEEGVRGIRANHPEVAANREQLAQLAIQELSAEDRETLEKAAPVLSAISEGALAEDFAEDIPELINDALLPLPSGAPRLPGADARTRIFSRVSKMALLSEKTKTGLKKGAEAFDSDLVKTIQLAGVTIGLGAGAVGFLYKLVEIGLRVFGVL